MLRKLIPQSWKTAIRAKQRLSADRKSGFIDQLCGKGSINHVKGKITVEQPVFVTSRSANKVDNIQLAKGRIEEVVIKPGQTFSFWKCVGKPNAANGFKLGRNLIDGELKEDYGGGLCQLASITYHLSIMAGIDVIERHNHTVDLYAENERFTPLGADAAVVYGYKDLRLANNTNSDLSFRYTVKPNAVIAELLSTSDIQEKKIVYDRQELEGARKVKTAYEDGTAIASSKYKVLSNE